MEFTGTRLIALPPEAVWDRLTDPDALRAAVPGCTALTGSAETGFEMTVSQKLGPMAVTFHGTITPVTVDRPRHCHMRGAGKGGIAGRLHGSADVALAPRGGGTRLDYRIGAELAGWIDRLAHGLVAGAAERAADAFFARVFGEAAVTTPEVTPGVTPSTGSPRSGP